MGKAITVKFISKEFHVAEKVLLMNEDVSYRKLEGLYSYSRFELIKYLYFFFSIRVW